MAERDGDDVWVKDATLPFINKHLDPIENISWYYCYYYMMGIIPME